MPSTFVVTLNVTVSPGSTSSLSGDTVAVSSPLASGVVKDVPTWLPEAMNPPCGAASIKTEYSELGSSPSS